MPQKQFEALNKLCLPLIAAVGVAGAEVLSCCCLLMLPRQQTVRQRQRQRQRQSYRGGKHFSNLQLAYREHSTVRSERVGRDVGGEVSPVESRESFMHADNPRLDALPCKSGCWCPVQASYGFTAPTTVGMGTRGRGREMDCSGMRRYITLG